jgi:hypothetical protein
VVAALLDLLTWWRTDSLIAMFVTLWLILPAADDTQPGSSAVVGAAVLLLVQPRRLKAAVVGRAFHPAAMAEARSAHSKAESEWQRALELERRLKATYR